MYLMPHEDRDVEVQKNLQMPCDGDLTRGCAAGKFNEHRLSKKPWHRDSHVYCLTSTPVNTKGRESCDLTAE